MQERDQDNVKKTLLEKENMHSLSLSLFVKNMGNIKKGYRRNQHRAWNKIIAWERNIEIGLLGRCIWTPVHVIHATSCSSYSLNKVNNTYVRNETIPQAVSLLVALLPGDCVLCLGVKKLRWSLILPNKECSIDIWRMLARSWNDLPRCV